MFQRHPLVTGKNGLYLVVFKPDRLINLRAFQGDQVETKRFIKIISNTINFENCSSQPTKGTITRHTHSSTYFKEASSSTSFE
jgi:hypothetical protein